MDLEQLRKIWRISIGTTGEKSSDWIKDRLLVLEPTSRPRNCFTFRRIVVVESAVARVNDISKLWNSSWPPAFVSANSWSYHACRQPAVELAADPFALNYVSNFPSFFSLFPFFFFHPSDLLSRSFACFFLERSLPAYEEIHLSSADGFRIKGEAFCYCLFFRQKECYIK